MERLDFSTGFDGKTGERGERNSLERTHDGKYKKSNESVEKIISSLRTHSSYPSAAVRLCIRLTMFAKYLLISMFPKQFFFL